MKRLKEAVEDFDIEQVKGLFGEGALAEEVAEFVYDNFRYVIHGSFKMLVDRIVDDYNGKKWFRSVYNGGNEFNLRQDLEAVLGDMAVADFRNIIDKAYPGV